MVIGTGVDITEVKRLKSAVEKWGRGFLRRIFTKEELESSRGRISLYQHLAGRFAAKEAIFKAMGDKTLGWKDVQVFNDPDGKPYCRILNNKGSNLTVHVSISHVKNYAVANAVVTPKE
ncbi:MAG: holo-ACP synthase [Candidatus Omnitrophota bacterium]